MVDRQFSTLSLSLPMSKVPFDSGAKALSSRTERGFQDANPGIRRPGSARKHLEQPDQSKDAGRRFSMLPLPRVRKATEARPPPESSRNVPVTRARTKQAGQSSTEAMSFLARTEAQLDALSLNDPPVVHRTFAPHNNATKTPQGKLVPGTSQVLQPQTLTNNPPQTLSRDW